jgi:DNA invertase Pin-like site-specific DNA recombinase
MMRRFAWYGRLSTKDKQDPTLSFPSQREICATKATELGGEIVCDFTDQEAGRRDDRAGWADLLREAKERDARRFNAVIIYSTSRLSRDLFHALTYEREMTRAGVEVFYARRRSSSPSSKTRAGTALP